MIKKIILIVTLFLSSLIIGFFLPKFFSKKNPKIKFETKQIDLGERNQFDDVFAYFIFTNIGE